ncbi:hypothetical protein OAK19_03305 [Aureispira]|nr:hypothetical protein [Aureispira sp.]
MNTKHVNRGFLSKELSLIRFCVFFLFIGRAWQGLFWDLPLRAFFWDQYLLEGVVTYLTNDSWQQYVTNKSINIDTIINSLGFFTGVFWLSCAILSLIIRKEWKWAKYYIYIASFSLFLLALLYFKERFYALGQLFEYSIQITAPLILIYVINERKNNKYFRLVLKGLIAVTFICHGIYACGFYPTPGIWIQWCLDILFISSDDTAKHFLFVMGILDFLAAFGLFFKFSFRIAVWYCILWGTLTAAIRLISNFYLNIPLESLHQWAYEMFYRLVHGGIPLLLLWCSKEKV